MSARDLLQHLQRAEFRLDVLDGMRLRIAPASALTAEDRAAIKLHCHELVELLSCPATEREPAPDQPALVEIDDDRVVCLACRNYRPGRCANHRQAGLSTAEIGPELAALAQRCPGYASRS